MQARMVRFEGTVVTTAAFIESIIEQGFTQITSEKRGAVPRYYLGNGNGSQYLMDAKNGMLEYARMLLEQVGTDQSDTTH